MALSNGLTVGLATAGRIFLIIDNHLDDINDRRLIVADSLVLLFRSCFAIIDSKRLALIINDWH
jgi:hypothetical protein